MATTFRPRKSYRNLGIGGFCFFAPFFLLSLYWAIWDRGDQAGRAVLMAAGFGLFLLLYVWLWLFYLREKLFFGNGTIEHRGVLRSKRLPVEHVALVRWRRWPQGGSVVLKSSDTRSVIEFETYEPAERIEIAKFLLESLAAARHEGWEKFCLQIAMPWCRRARDVSREPGEGEMLITRRRYDRAFPWLIALTAVAGLAAWWIMDEPGFLGMVPVVAAAWLLLRQSTPKKGVVQPTTSEPGTRRFLVFLAVWGGALIATMTLIERNEQRLAAPMFWMTATLVFGVAGLLAGAFWADRKRDQARASEAADAAKAWEREASH